MARTITLTLPLPPNRGNSRMHWRARHRAQLVYRARCDIARVEAGVKLLREPMQRARFAATLYVWNLYDPDGAVALCKWPLDWLVERGFLAGDTRDRLEWAGMPDQHIDRTNRRLVLTLTELLDDNNGGAR